MKKSILFLIPCTLMLSGCGSGGNPLSTLGIMPAQKEQIDYSPRPPLAIPPEDQRSALPPPQEELRSPLAPAQQDVAVAPPPVYATPAPPPPQAAPAAEPDTPWWVGIFGS